MSSLPRRVARVLFDRGAGIIPLAAFPALALLERSAARVQGRGFGSRTIHEEVGAVLPYVPSSGATVVDVGANEGEWTRMLLTHAGHRVSRIFAVEPSLAHATALSAINDERVTIVRHAIGSCTEERTLYTDLPGSGVASLYRRDLSHLGISISREERVSVITLDDLFDSQAIEKCDVLKMDIEGHELDALHGAQRALQRGKIKLLTFEMGGCNVESRTYFRDFWTLLAGHGFEIHRIVPAAGALYRLGKYAERDEFFSPTNYAAILK